jgi:hypothetical protein
MLYSFRHDKTVPLEGYALAQGFKAEDAHALESICSRQGKPQAIFADAYNLQLLAIATSVFFFNPLAPWWKPCVDSY